MPQPLVMSSEKSVEHIARALGNPRRNGDGWLARCPAHDDKNPSLSLKNHNGRILVHCHAGCSQEAVVAALKARGLWPGHDPAEAPLRPRGIPAELDGARFAKAWDYRDAAGNLLGFVCRFDGPGGKVIRPAFRREGDQWRFGGAPKPWPLFRLDVLTANPDKPVLLAEGEKAAEAAQALMPDSVATTTLHGARAPRNTDFTPLRGRKVLIWPDNDPPGLEYAKRVRDLALAAGALEVKILDPSRLELPEKGDAADWPAGKPLPDPLPMPDDVPKAEPADEDEADATLPLPPWPIEAFHEPLRRLIEETAESFACPLETVSAAVVSVLAACIGRTRSIHVGRNWFEPAILWIAVAAPSGSGKTPVTSFLLKPIFKKEQTWFDDYKRELSEYEVALERWRATKKERRGDKPTPPSYTQLVVDDSTTEALTDALAGNPRGVLWCRDELSGLLLDLDRYAPTQGGTKARLLSAYDAGAWKVSRVAAYRRAFIPHAAVGMLGGVQPRVLPRIFTDIDTVNGFLPRFQFVFPTRKAPPTWRDAIVSKEVQNLWGVFIHHLLALDFAPDGNPLVVRVSRKARELFVEWHDELATMPWREPAGEALEPFAAKMRGRALRLALVFHEVDCFLRGCVDHETPVTADTMRRALALCDVLFEHQKLALAHMRPGGPWGVFSPLHLRIAEAIVALQDRIENGAIPTAVVTSHMNEQAPSRLHVTARAVGKSAGRLGLYSKVTTYRGEKCRCLVVDPRSLARLKSLLYDVANVENVTGQAKSRLREGTFSKSITLKTLPTNATETDEVTLSTFSNSKRSPANPHESRESNVINVINGSRTENGGFEPRAETFEDGTTDANAEQDVPPAEPKESDPGCVGCLHFKPNPPWTLSGGWCTLSPQRRKPAGKCGKFTEILSTGRVL